MIAAFSLIVLSCRWLTVKEAVKLSWSCARYRCLREMLGRCWCGTVVKLHWYASNTCTCNTSMCRCRQLRMAIQTWSHCCWLCHTWLHSVERCTISRLLCWHLGSRVSMLYSQYTSSSCKCDILGKGVDDDSICQIYVQPL